MSTLSDPSDPNARYGRHSLRFSPRAGSGLAEGHISKGTFCLGHIHIPLMSREPGESAYLLTVSSDADPNHCIEIILNEEDFTHAIQQAILDRLEDQEQFAIPKDGPQ